MMTAPHVKPGEEALSARVSDCNTGGAIALRLVVWSLAVVLSFAAIHLILVPRLAPVEYRDLANNRLLRPQSQAYRWIMLGVSSVGPQRLVIGLDTHDLVSSNSVEISLPELGYTCSWYQDRDGWQSEKAGRGLNSDILWRWLVRSGVDANNIQARAEMDDLFQVVKSMSNGKDIATACKQVRLFEVEPLLVPVRNIRGPWWLTASEAMLGAALWLSGVVWLKRKVRAGEITIALSTPGHG